MEKFWSFLVILFHGCISFRTETDFTKQDDVVSHDDVYKIWTLVLGVIVIGDFTRMHATVKENRFNCHVFNVCFSILVNTFLLHYTCPALAYCFLLHAVASVCSNVASDAYSPLSSRLCGGFFLVFTFLGIFLSPKPFEMLSKVYFIDYKSKAYHDLSFETAHLCAIFFGIVVDILAAFSDFVFS